MILMAEAKPIAIPKWEQAPSAKPPRLTGAARRAPLPACSSLRSDLAVASLRLALRSPFPAVAGSPPVEWRVASDLVEYPNALAEMESRAEAIAEGRTPERVWLIEHPPLYTAGTSAKPADLLEARFPVYRAGRGGQFTYHGPGQRVAYVMLDLKRRRPDVRAYVAALEGWLIDALRGLGVEGETREDRVGVWVARPDKPPGIDGSPAEDKIAAIGVRVRRWTTFHGVSLNVAPDLSHFSGIVPCGIGAAHYGVTSLADLGRAATMADADRALRTAFEARFGPTVDA
jgi:lipoyl(octanoyl) transferase